MKKLFTTFLMLPAVIATASAAENQIYCKHYGHFASAPMAFDEATGARAEHFPRPRNMDIEHISLELTFADLSTRSAEVEEVIEFSTPFEPVDEISLNAEGLEIHSVELLEGSGPHSLEYYHDGSELFVGFPQTIEQDSNVSIRINYSINDPERGLYWIAPMEGGPEDTWQVWSQGQSENNRYWFVTHDYPNDRHTSELIAHVPAGNVVSAAGRLDSREERGDMVTYHWKMEQPHVSYLTTLAISDFHVEREEWRGKDVEYYVPQRFAADTNRSFNETPAMLEFFSEKFDEEYPYDRYAQIVVDEYMYGGMENITASTLVNRAVIGEATEMHSDQCYSGIDGLIAHELGHQWFGDMMTCRTWAHTWLNEGWAAYCEDIWAEYQCSREQYEYEIWGRMQGQARRDKPETKQALVFTNTPGDWAVFGFNGSAVYNKGASVLHMLREHLGEDDFWQGVADYIDRHKFTTVTTEEFRLALEDASGRDLEAFFRQWCYTPGTPTMSVSLNYSPSTRIAKVRIDQTQQISELSPAFHGDYALYFETENGEVVTETVSLKNKSEEFEIRLPGKPVIFAPNYRAGFLSGLEQRVSPEILAETAKRGPTAFSRLWAIEALKEIGGITAIREFNEIINDTSAFYAEREKAAEALGAIDNEKAGFALKEIAEEMLALPSNETDWRVRATVAESLRNFDDEIALEPLLKLAEDPSEIVARYAAASLGYMRSDEVTPVLIAAAERRGEHDRILDEALGALKQRGDTEALEVALEATKPDVHDRVRGGAVSTVAALLDGQEIEDGNPAAERLIELLDDQQWRARRAAISGLARIKYEPALPILEKMKAKRSDWADSAAEAISEIQSKEPTHENFLALQRKFDELQRKFEEVEKQMEEKELQDFRERIGADEEEEPKSRKRFLGIF